ncbi:hypothetical protein Pan216_36790 [Planctomycetes bacterium Pan216]|uniref:Carboxypeptidase regulatory-like domain-containing protein n=1 Tax=Kolteria novifilia TaxID=2527975 RepID=A0A518B753_9BACT|nr:hypothetical protein Pan216_36790 [Planctomycetes bacterium Pan216]
MSQRRTRTFVNRVGLGVLLLAGVGCSHRPHSDRPVGNVVITLMQAGSPMTSGQVNLVNPTIAGGGGGSVGADGTVTMSDILEGEYTVVVLPPDLMGEPVEENPVPGRLAFDKSFPKKYRSPQTSPLKTKVIEGDTTQVTFELE